jgi:GAF domain-containing protein
MSQELLHAIVDRARHTFRAQACSILLHEPESRLFVFAAMSGEGSEPLGGSESLVGVKFPDTAGVAGWVLATGEPVVLEDVARDGRFARDIAEITGYVPRRLMAMPLLLDDRVLGVLEVLDCLEQAKFTETDQLGDFAEEVVRALTDPGLEE